MITPELLSPAGSLKNMRYAFAYGADAVYAGQPRYSLRVRNNEFTTDKLHAAINEAHNLNKKLYVVNNIAPHNAKLKTFIKDVSPIVNMQPDAFIMSDPGLIMLMRESFPDVDIHLSVQANAINWASVKFWEQQGIKRVILSRELSLDEIEEIRFRCPDIELEVFVHGALCMAYSGRCLLSGYINKRDPNQGTCTNACRWEYKTHSAVENDAGDAVKIHPATSPFQSQDSGTSITSMPTLGEGSTTDDIFLLEEPGRPGELMPAYEDEHGTYIMNSKDLRAIEHVERLTKIGIHSLKIEGRTKSFFYCARTAQIYSKAIQNAVNGERFDKSLVVALDGLAHRGYTDGFLQRHKHSDYQNYEYGHSVSNTQQLVGQIMQVEKCDKLPEQTLLKVDVKNKFIVGDSLELMTPNGNVHFELNDIFDKNLQLISEALGSGHIVYIPVPAQLLAQKIQNIDSEIEHIKSETIDFLTKDKCDRDSDNTNADSQDVLSQESLQYAILIRNLVEGTDTRSAFQSSKAAKA